MRHDHWAERMNPRVVVRGFEPEHLEDVVDIERSCFNTDAYSPSVFKSLWQRNPEGFLVAKKEGVAIGYIATTSLRGEAHLISMAVVETERRRGVGTLMLKRAIRLMKRSRIHLLRLEVREDNQPAILFYHSHGFCAVGTKHSYYSDGGGALLMERKL